VRGAATDASRAPLNACRQTLSAAIAALADQVEILDQAAKRHPRDD